MKTAAPWSSRNQQRSDRTGAAITRAACGRGGRRRQVGGDGRQSGLLGVGVATHDAKQRGDEQAEQDQQEHGDRCGRADPEALQGDSGRCPG